MEFSRSTIKYVLYFRGELSELEKKKKNTLKKFFLFSSSPNLSSPKKLNETFLCP